MKDYSKRKGKIILLVLLISMVGAACYINTMDGEFVWDDIYLIPDNAFVRSNVPLYQVFGHSIRAGAGEMNDDFYRPLQMLTYMWDYKLWNLDVRGYHLTNIILHVLVALSLFWLIHLWFKDLFLAWGTSLLFVVHPVHTEAVAYLSGRADVLMALFFFLAFIFYLRFIDRFSVHSLTLCLIAYACSLLSKEYALILPALILLYHWWGARRIPWLPFGSILCIAIVYIIVRSRLIQVVLDPTFIPPPFHKRLPGVFIAFFDYVRLLLFPVGLHMEYGGIYFSFFHIKAWAGIILLGAIAYSMYRAWHVKRPVVFGLCWFVVALIPHSNLFPLNAYMAEHWLYIPSVGFFLCAALACQTIGKKCSWPRGAWILVGLLTIVWGMLTYQQNKVWRNPITLYEHTLKYAPESARVTNNLGIVYYQKGQKQKGIQLFKRAIQLESKYFNAYVNLGNALRYEKKYEETKQLYEKALSMRPNDAGIINNLGNVYQDQGQLKEALQYYLKAISINPYLVSSINNVGLVYHKLGQHPEAKKYFQQAVNIDPNYSEAYYSLGIVYFESGEYDKALESAQRANELGYPDSALLHALQQIHQ